MDSFQPKNNNRACWEFIRYLQPSLPEYPDVLRLQVDQVKEISKDGNWIKVLKYKQYDIAWFVNSDRVHVGMLTGPQKFIHYHEAQIRIDRIYESPWVNTLVGVYRHNAKQT